jgi:hypothetical protein
MPLARQLGEKLSLEPIPELEQIAGNTFRCTRKDIWPPDVWEEMNRIWNGEQE